jgi:2-polyprenyl-3-methyl-5-hydroxy-6-metoxy-1,4-benzoquinol methylase
MAKSFKDYEQEGWSKKASQYERVTLPLTSQAFEPILSSFGQLTGKRLLDVCTGPGHLAGEAAARGALVDAVDFSRGETATSCANRSRQSKPALWGYAAGPRATWPSCHDSAERAS